MVFFSCQTTPTWSHVSGGNAYYFPGCDLNLLNCLQTHLFHVAQWENPRASTRFCVPLSFLPLQSLPPSGLPRYDFIANRSWNTLYGHFPFWSVYVLRCVLSLLMGDVPLSVHSKFMLWSCFKVPCGGLWREIRPGSYTENQAGKSALSSGVPSMAPRNVEL